MTSSPRLALFSALACLGLVACGSATEDAGSSSTTTSATTATGSGGGGGEGGQGGATTGAGGTSTGSGGSGGTSAGGSGGAGVGGAGGSGGAGVGGAGGSGGAPCVGEIKIAVDNGALETFSFSCAGQWGSGDSATPLGYEFAGGPVGAPHGYVVEGCAAAAAGARGVRFSVLDATGPGKFTSGVTTYTDENGSAWGVDGDPFSVTITSLEGVGGAIEGNFFVSVTHGGNAAHSLGGTFHVCHVPDLLAP